MDLDPQTTPTPEVEENNVEEIDEKTKQKWKAMPELKYVGDIQVIILRENFALVFKNWLDEDSAVAVIGDGALEKLIKDGQEALEEVKGKNEKGDADGNGNSG
jgi:hypothetical protein